MEISLVWAKDHIGLQFIKYTCIIPAINSSIVKLHKVHFVGFKSELGAPLCTSTGRELNSLIGCEPSPFSELSRQKGSV